MQLQGGKATLPELLAGIDRALLVTRFWYIRTLDPRLILATGLTRDGLFLVEKGEIVGPVNNLRFNESPVNMLKNADLYGPSVVTETGTRAPWLRAHDFTFSSVSEAV
jgi:predicted Zn-dependent protease